MGRAGRVTASRRSFSPALLAHLRAYVESGTCAYCAMPAETYDHVEPFSKVRSNHTDNLVPCCRQCNEDKADMPLVVFLALSHHVEPGFNRFIEQGGAMVQPDRSEVSVENRGKVRRFADAIVRFLDRIAPPFTAPEATNEAVTSLQDHALARRVERSTGRQDGSRQDGR